jgi:OOP family OmpA-OmpF porin
MSQTLIRNLVVTAAGLLAAQAASAAETGFYVGGSYGIAEKDEGFETTFDAFRDSAHADLGFTRKASTSTLDTRSKGYGFIGGYRLFENLAVEGGYMQLGTVKYRDRSSGTYPGVPTDAVPAPANTPANYLLNLDSEIGGIAISALGIVPLSYRWEVFGRAGVMFSTHDLIYYVDPGNGLAPLRNGFSESATDFLAGAGASIMLAEVYTLRAEFIRVFDAGNKENGEGDIDVLSIGVTVKF